MDHKISKDMISSGMIPSGEKSQADLGRTQYGSAPSPSSLMDAYKSIYEHHQKDADGKVIEHEEEEIKVNEGVGEFLDNKIKKPIKKKVDNALTGLTQKFHLGSTKELGSVASPHSGTYKEDVDGVDLFDIIKGRLLDEGADEEEALKIMANISQEDFDKLKEDITLTKGDYGSRNTKGSAYNTAKSKGFKGYKAGGGLGADFLPRV